MYEKIEILPVALLDQYRSTVNELKTLARSLRLEFGWHYLLDLAWIYHQLGPVQGLLILDAGAGTGILQWYLAEKGAQILSVDRSSRALLPLRYRQRYQARGLRPADLAPASKVVLANLGSRSGLRSLAQDFPDLIAPKRSTGQVTIYHQNLKTLVDVNDRTFDAVIAVSALEHNPPDELPVVVGELMRVLKPGGKLAATLGAAREQDWFHQPSQGWCYTEASLRRLFDLPADASSNYTDYDKLFAALCDCAELRDNLASFYFKSGDNGMPWGKWDPQYQSVGVLKVKPAAT